MNKRTKTQNPTDRFSVDVFDAYSGWDGPESATRKEAWDIAKWAKKYNHPIRICVAHPDGTLGDTVYESGDEESAYHSAWLGRCPR